MQNSRPTTEVVIGEKEFTIEHWSPTKAMKNLPKVGKYFAVPLATVVGSLGSGGQNLSEALPTACVYLFDQMEEDDIMKFFNMALEDVYYNGSSKIDIDSVFANDISELFELVAAVLQANYGCFFKKAGFASLQNLLQKMGMVNTIPDPNKPNSQEQ